MKIDLIAIPRILVLFVLAVFPAFGQTPSPSPQDDEVVKITTKLVQLDVIVTDKDGNQVPDLSADNFTILQDGKPQKITGISYVGTAAASDVSPTPAKKAAKGAILPPPVRMRPSENSRIITFIVDDGNCSASFSGMIAAKEGIEKFINQQMLANDIVAIYRTRAGSSVFQQYTSDKAQLLKAAQKIRWYPASGSCGTNDGSFYEAARINTIDKQVSSGAQSITIESEQQRKNREAGEDAAQNSQVVGSVGVLRYVISGLDRVPGRKIVFFISDGLRFRSRGGEFLSARDAIRDVTDLANRASVVVNTIDARGLFDPGMIEARDEVSTLGNPAATASISDQRRKDVFDSQGGLAFIADETGGIFSQGQNFLDAPIRRSLQREKGYYLIAYEPSDDTFKGKKFHNIDVKVDRPGLKVVSRSGFMPVSDELVKPKKKTGDSELYEAIIAPIPRPGLSVQMSAFFVNTTPDSNFVRAMFHLDGSELTYVDEPGGLKKVVFDVAAVTLNEKNKVVDEFTRTHIFKFDAAGLSVALKNGLTYSTDVPIKKSGTYNFRVAVRDANGHNLGSASQLVEVPNLKKNGLFLSGLTMTGVDAQGKFAVPGPTKAENAVSLPASMAVPAIRRFAPGSIMAYLYTLYNAGVDPKTGKPDLSIQVNLFHNGQMVLEGKPQPAELEAQTDWSRISDYGYMKLNPASEPGDYALQVIVNDLSSDGKKSITSQWIDFEIGE